SIAPLRPSAPKSRSDAAFYAIPRGLRAYSMPGPLLGLQIDTTLFCAARSREHLLHAGLPASRSRPWPDHQCAAFAIGCRFAERSVLHRVDSEAGGEYGQGAKLRGGRPRDEAPPGGAPPPSP